MRGHIGVLPSIAVSLATAEGGGVVVGLSKVGVEAVEEAAVSRIVGVGDGWRNWAGRHAHARDIIAVQTARTVYYAHCSRDIAIERWIRGADGHTAPSGVVCKGAWRASGQAAHRAVVSKRVLRADRNTEGGRVVSEGAPKTAVLHALARVIFSEAVVGTSEHTDPG